MNVSTRNIDNLNAVMTVEIQPEDYREKVDKVLKDYRKRANIPGFRKGHVPASLIRKQYGKSVLIEEINHILQHAVYEHIQEKDLDILGNPIPREQSGIDWENQEKFDFEYELGLAPDFELNISEKTKVPYYKIKADKEMVDRYVNDYAKRFGKMSYPEEVEDNCIVKADFTEVDKEGNPVENGITESATFSLDNVEDHKTLKTLKGLTRDDKVKMNVKKAFKKDFNVANLLGVKEDVLENSKGDFELILTEISRLDPAEVNQELFDKIFNGEVKSEEEFRERIAQDAEKMFQGESDRKFYEDVKETLLKKMDFELPEEFLKKWMQTAGEKSMSPEEAEEQFPQMKESMRWQLVENKVIKEHGIEVTDEEIKERTKHLVANQMAQYGQMPEDAELGDVAERVLQNKDEAQRITDQVYSEKLMDFFKEKVNLNEKECTFDEFMKKMSK